MGFLSLFGHKQKKRRKKGPVKPRAPRSAVARALRHTAASTGSLTAAELGQRIATGFSTLETAVLAIDTISDRLREAAELTAAAAITEDPGRRALLAGRYDDVRAEIDAVAGSASHNRINLINGRLIGGHAPSFDIALDEEGRAGVAIQVVNLTTGAGGLELSPPRSAFAENAEIETIAREIEAAQALVARTSERFADHAAFIAGRLTHLRSLAGPRSIEPFLPTGADIEPQGSAGETEETANPIDLGIAEVEHRLRDLASRLGRRGEPDAVTPSGAVAEKSAAAE